MIWNRHCAANISFIPSTPCARRRSFAALAVCAALAAAGCSSDNAGGGTGGGTGTGGTTGVGGSAGAGGTSATGGAPGSGGTAATGGAAGSGGSGDAAAGTGGSAPDASTSGDGAAGPGDASADAPACNTAPGKALQFNGTIVDLMTGDLGADLPGGDVPRTIEVWTKFLGAQSWTAEHSIMETGLRVNAANQVFGLDLSGYAGTTAQFGPYTNGYSDNNNPNGVFVMNIPQMGWLHLSWSYTGNHGTFSFTVDGTEYPVITQAGAATMAFTQGIVTLGASQSFGTMGWTGVMDEVRIWSIARTPAEVQRDMRVVLKGTEPGLVAYYRFDEGSGTFTDDVRAVASHRLSVCTATSMRCAAANTANSMWVDSDLPGAFTCAP